MIKLKATSLIQKISLLLGTMLLGSGVGFLIGWILLGEYNPPWDVHQVSKIPATPVEIVHVEIYSTETDPTNDTIFVLDDQGEVLSNKLFQSDWQEVNPTPEWESDYLRDCTTQRLGPTSSHLWDTPPVDQRVLDSSGVIFERPLSTIVRCYVLLKDGSLEIWVHSGNVYDLINNYLVRIVFVLIGMVTGCIYGVRYLKRVEREGNVIEQPDKLIFDN